MSLSIAIVGSGPAGLFAADEILRKRPGTLIHVYEQDPAPFGLVRYGVAPDHPQTRRAVKLLEATLAKPGVHLHLGQRVGRDCTLDSLRAANDAVILACGAAIDRSIGLPGDTKPGYWTSTRFAHWINGHPSTEHLRPPTHTTDVVILGNGNVALDAARLLARTADELRPTDISPTARDALSQLGIQRITIVGRRGPEQAAFGAVELDEVARLTGWHVHAEDAVLSDEQRNRAASSDDRTKAILSTFDHLSRKPRASDGERRITFGFQLRPVQAEGVDAVTGIRLERTRLEGSGAQARSQGTGVELYLPAQWIIQATGHTGERLEGAPFLDASGIVPSAAGRVLEGDQPVHGLYVTGWLRRGAKGLIGHNRRDAMETVASLLADFPV